MSAGSVSALRKRKATTPLTSLSPADRTAKLLGYRGQTHNFTTTTTPSKPIHTARGWMRTV